MKKKTLTDCLDLAVAVIEQDLKNEQQVSYEAMKVMGYLEDELSSDLCDQLKAMLLGFSRDMQAEIASDMLMFVEDKIMFTTGCESVDYVLDVCYHWIAEEQGFKIVGL